MGSPNDGVPTRRPLATQKSPTSSFFSFEHATEETSGPSDLMARATLGEGKRYKRRVPSSGNAKLRNLYQPRER